MSFVDFASPARALGGPELLDSTTIRLMRQPTSHEMAQIHVQGSSPENNDVPQRSRNARAQARHRQKRKAYIEKLEENVAKLQAILGLTSEQVSELPPASVLTNRFAELEMENRRLHEQLRALQQALHGGRYPIEGHNGARWSPESPIASDFPQSSLAGSENAACTRESKKRKLSFEQEDQYTSQDQVSLSPTMAASPMSVQHAPNVTGPINIEMGNGNGQTAVRMSFSPTNERLLPQQPASTTNGSYSGIRQQYLAHEQLTSIAQQGQVQHQGLYHAAQHSTSFSPALTNRVPQLMLGTNGLHHQHPQVSMYTNGHGGGGGSPIVPSPIGGNPWGTAGPLVAGKRM
ncbi:SubName: Full=Uncharacterized protein {ECO:0000313/EMBL:CCA72952.1} [Serendipita indica DSM 11827]|nr:SubName: Full=Uncharacterized protein {ECO:0000313/EMBL:CCA72952.1} [Serendipita indica DSM 11827]